MIAANETQSVWQSIPDSALQACIRAGTTDEKVFAEIFHKKVYRKVKANFDAQPDDVWIDLGSHAGMFMLYAARAGARKVYCYEAEASNFAQLNAVVKHNELEPKVDCFHAAVLNQCEDSHVDLYLARADYNNYRHTVVPTRRRRTVSVPCLNFQDVLDRHPDANAVKIDIEGAEVDILSNAELRWNNVKKITFEYTVKSFALRDILRALEDVHGFTVFYFPSLLKTFDRKVSVSFPDSVLFAVRP